MTPRPADPRRLARLALLTAVALTIFLIEVQLPVLPIPGAKLGLANIVTVYAVMALGPGDALLILLSRVDRNFNARHRQVETILQVAHCMHI